MLEQLSKYQIILASRSPRRQLLLEGLKIPFIVKNIPLEERFPEHLPAPKIPVYLANLKAEVYADKLKENELLITADTVVVLRKKVIGKPKSKEEAIEILQKISGKKHKVITGICIKAGNKKKLFSDTTTVYFNELLLKEIEHYVDNYKPYDKAGAYGIQEWIGYIGIRKIKGSYYNVMGLPIQKLYKALQEF